MKVVYNSYFGGYGLSEKAMKLYNERAGRIVEYDCDITRHDPILVSVVEELGEEANDRLSELAIIDIPEGYDYIIDEYDGVEGVELVPLEDVLRDKIRAGDEEDIVDYVMMLRTWVDVYDDYIVDLEDELEKAEGK